MLYEERYLDIFKKEHERNIEKLSALDPTSEGYNRVLRNLAEIARRYFDAEYELNNQNKTITLIDVSTPPAPAQSEEEFEELNEPDPAPAQSEEELTKEHVRELLVDASNSGVQIQPIIAKFVPEGSPIKFSEIPRDRYKDLIEELRNAG